MPGSSVVKPPCVAERPGAKRGGIDCAVCNVSEALIKRRQAMPACEWEIEGAEPVTRR